MNSDNEPLEEKYNRYLKAIDDYTIKIEYMTKNANKITRENVERVLDELVKMRDDSIKIGEELLILQKMMGAE